MEDSPKLAALRILVEDDPRNAELRFHLGKCLVENGDASHVGEAIQHLQQATRDPRIRPEVLALMKRVSRAFGDDDLTN